MARDSLKRPALVVRNVTRGTTVAGAVEVARGPVARGVGLMGRRDWARGDGLLLERCGSIHTFFMRLPIDVAYLRRDGSVARCASAMRWDPLESTCRHASLSIL